MRGVEIGGGISMGARMGGISTISRGPSIGSIARIGMPRPERGFSVNRIANPFNSQVREFRGVRERVRPQFSAASVIAEAEAIITKAQRPLVIARRADFLTRRGNLNHEIASLPLVARNDVRRQILVRAPKPNFELKSFQAPKVQPEAQAKIQPKTESNPGYRVRRIVSPALASRVQTEQVKAERLKPEQKQEEKAGQRQSEKRSVAKIKFSEAVEISKKRANALKKAYQEIKTRGLSIRLLRAFLSRPYWEAISPIARNGHDGTLNLTVVELEKQSGEYQSESKVDQAVSFAVSNHIPVQKGEGGRLATIEEVREVLEGKEKGVIKLNTPAEIVTRRVVSKNVELVRAGQTVAVSEEKEEVLEEPTLKSLGLEEVYLKIFPKAA